MNSEVSGWPCGMMLVAKGGGGSSGGSSGGGGSSGKVEWPGYFETIHDRWLTTGGGIGSGMENKTMDDAIEALYDNSPYAGAYTYDPTADFDEIFAELARYKQEVLAVKPEVNFEEMLEEAQRLFPNQAFTLDNTGLLRQIAQFAAGMADIGAENSSAYAWGVALMHSEFAKEEARVKAQLAHQTRVAQLSAVDQMNRALQFRIESSRQLLHYTTEAYRMHVVAQKEMLDTDLNIAVRDATWVLDIFQPAANLLAAGHGGVSTGGAMEKGSASTAASMLGGALSGASSGAMLGSMGGPWGTAIGAVAGGLGGAFMNG